MESVYKTKMGVIPKKFKYKQKKDNRGSTIKGVYTRVCVSVEQIMTMRLPCQVYQNKVVSFNTGGGFGVFLPSVPCCTHQTLSFYLLGFFALANLPGLSLLADGILVVGFRFYCLLHTDDTL